MAAYAPGILARGPWDPGSIDVCWRSERYEPGAEVVEAADEALAALRARGSPSHDGLAARLASFQSTAGGLQLELQPARWALRLLPGMADRSLAVMCIVRAADGSWLAGHRAAWVASWPGRWALGAGGSVEVDEDPIDALGRELREEWSVDPHELKVEALVLLETGLAMLVGQAWLADGADVSPDPEHDGFAWWPAEVSQWPDEADEPLRRMAALLSG